MITFNNKEPKEITIGGKTVSTIEMNNEVVWSYQYFNFSNVELHTVTTDEYTVYGDVDTNINYSRVTIDISNIDDGPGNKNAYLDFTPNDVTAGQLVSSSNISILFGSPDTWMTITVYDDNNLLVYTKDHIPYTII